MRITVTLPDDLAASLLPQGQEPARATLEALALEAYRRPPVITGYQIRTLLGIPSRYEPDGFLKQPMSTITYRRFLITTSPPFGN